MDLTGGAMRFCLRQFRLGGGQTPWGNGTGSFFSAPFRACHGGPYKRDIADGIGAVMIACQQVLKWGSMCKRG